MLSGYTQYVTVYWLYIIYTNQEHQTMRKSTRQLNKKLLDSLTVNESKVQDGIAKITAMTLALLF